MFLEGSLIFQIYCIISRVLYAIAIDSNFHDRSLKRNNEYDPDRSITELGGAKRS